MKNPYLKLQWIISLLCRFVFLIYHQQDFTGLECKYHGGRHNKYELFTLCENLSSLLLFLLFLVVHRFTFLCHVCVLLGFFLHSFCVWWLFSNGQNMVITVDVIHVIGILWLVATYLVHTILQLSPKYLITSDTRS